MFKWMLLSGVRNADGVDGGGAPAGGADAGAAAGADGGAPAADAGGTSGDVKVAVDGTVPAAEGTPPAGDPPKEGEEGKKPDVDGDEGKKDDDKPAEFKPEDYSFKLPDGAEPDPAQAEQFTSFAIENKVPPELAQKLVDFHADVIGRQVKAWTDQVNAWGEATKNDPEYGGAAYDQNMGIANRALAEFGGPKLGEAARQYGWGNHPEFVRMMVNVGKAMGIASTEKDGGNGNVGTGIDPTKALYGG